VLGEKRSISNIYRRRGAAAHEGCGQPLGLFLLFMVAVTPSFMER
jgi:hypothetical protein